MTATIHTMFAANDISDDLSWDIVVYVVEDIATATAVYASMNRDACVHWCELANHDVVDIDDIYQFATDSTRWVRKELSPWPPPTNAPLGP
jgi:hypothetical protein